MRTKTQRIFACDFETTVYKGQKFTEVWSAACVELKTEKVYVFKSIEEQFNFFKSLNTNIVAYYHNLKFDGSFWLSYLLREKSFKQAYNVLNKECTLFEWLKDKDMPSSSFKYSISDKGQWYTIKIKVGKLVIELRDSLKLLPFSLDRIGKAFETKHKKLTMNYTGFRYSGCGISDEEMEYIKNDVLVLKEALEIVFSEGHNKLTIGSCCLSEYKKIIGKYDWKFMFPDLTQIPLNPSEHRYTNADEWIRKSYRGGWCYLVKGKENNIFTNGTTADVNSLYPSMMSSESGNYYPRGEPTFWTGNYIPNEALYPERFFFIRVKTRFYIKDGFLPFVQIKGSPLYDSRECLETSDIYDKKTGEYYQFYTDYKGNRHDTRVELTFTQADFKLFLEHYNLVDYEILDGCWFRAEKGIFDTYIEKYKKIKIESKGAKRELAKLFLNNLYGKMATNTDSSFKVAYLKENGALGFYRVPENNKRTCFVAVGSAITAYARCFTIRAAQLNYHGKDKRGFIYADTDSIHCDLPPNEIKGITVHDRNFCCWKLEAQWDEAIFVRQKTYIEHVTGENLEAIDNPYYNVKCAGMPSRCKDLFVKSLQGESANENNSDDEKEFLKTKRELTDFKVGLIVPSQLKAKQIMGGVILNEQCYEMRPKI